VLTVREEFLLEHRPIVQQLVTEVLAAGRWLDTSMNNRFMGAEMAAKPEFFNQKPELIKFVMSHPMDRVTYSDLVPRPEEFDQFMTLALEAGMLERPISPQEYVDDSFAKAALEAERRAGGPSASDATIRTGPGQTGGMKMDRAQTKGIGR
jgi:NitT/TauT family transport system substrate-binding protein